MFQKPEAAYVKSFLHKQGFIAHISWFPFVDIKFIFSETGYRPRSLRNLPIIPSQSLFTIVSSPTPGTQFQKRSPRAPGWTEQLPSHNRCGMRPVCGPCLFLFMLPSPPREGPPPHLTHTLQLHQFETRSRGKLGLAEKNREALQIRLGLGMVLHACTPSTGEAEAGECRV